MEVARRSGNGLDGNAATVLAPAVFEPERSSPERSSPPLRVPSARRSGITLAVLAALAGVGALGLGSWAFVSEVRSDSSPALGTPSSVATERAISLLARPSTQRIPLVGSSGEIVLAVGVGGRGVLTLDGLERAPEGETFQAWLIGPNRRVIATAALFTGAETIVPLSQIVPPGSGIGVTLERSGGVPAPTRTLTLVALRVR